MPTRTAPATDRANVEREPYGRLPDGRAVELFTLTNANGAQVRIITFGGIITSLFIRDRDGKLEDVVLGFDSLEDYVADSAFFGAIVGRYANRIANARFEL